ncbi:MAG: GNAT family N-acetyltransferase [Phycisphaerales bacterium JB063]
MASLTDLPRPSPAGDDGLYLGLAPQERRRAALAQLLTGRPREDDPAVLHFEQFARDQKLNTDKVWVACSGGPGGRILAAVLVVPNAGGTAMLFAGSAAGWHDHTIAQRLIERACAPEENPGVYVVQALLDPGQVLEGRVLEQAGMTKLAKLVYMQCATDPRDHRIALPTTLGRAPVTAYRGDDEHMPRFHRAVEASYEDTLDCPGLLGLRPIEQVVAGHRATGRFSPALWHAFFDAEDRPVAVLLLAEVSQGGSHEVVYLGVAKPYRGRGVGSQLMAYALSTTTRYRGDRLFLAVDDRNEPAVRLYHGLGFRATTRKLAYILPR